MTTAEAIAGTLQTYPKAIEELALKFLGYETKMAELKAKSKEWETQRQGELASMSDEEGKKAFPNEATRAAELVHLKEADPQYRKWQDDIRTLVAQIESAKAELQRLRDEQTNARYLALLLAPDTYPGVS